MKWIVLGNEKMIEQKKIEKTKVFYCTNEFSKRSNDFLMNHFSAELTIISFRPFEKKTN